MANYQLISEDSNHKIFIVKSSGFLETIKDQRVKELVDVADRNCQEKFCYWPRPDPGSFTQGRGYHNTDRNG